VRNRFRFILFNEEPIFITLELLNSDQTVMEPPRGVPHHQSLRGYSPTSLDGDV